MQELLRTSLMLYIALTSFVFGAVDETRSNIFNVLDYGAFADGQHDDSEAFLKAWKELCEAEGSYYGLPMLEIPCGKTFKLKPVHFQGPCKSRSVQIKFFGTIIAPAYISGWTGCVGNSWLLFSNVDNLMINGSGKIDGQGENWWHKPKEHQKHKEIIRYQSLDFQGEGNCYSPAALRLSNCSNLHLRGLTHVNSPRSHIYISNSENVTLTNLNITAPESSPNTDGIHLSSSKNVSIHESTIATGDDCIAIKRNCSKINIKGIMCGPGHGISVGSLGAQGAYETVEEVFVGNCTFTESMYGARIKTWQGGSGYARNIHFQHIHLREAKNPIIIDQFYCNGRHDCKNSTEAVSVSNVTYFGVRGTSARKDAITLKCASTNCTNISMNKINISSWDYGSEVSAYCLNAKGTSSCTTPTVPCLNGVCEGGGDCGSEDFDLHLVSFPFLFIATSSFGIGYGQNGTYNVFDFGASGDGVADDSQTWQRACGTPGSSQALSIPQGKTYLLNPLRFLGPCKSNNVQIQVDGNIVGPSDPNVWTTACESGCWLCFEDVKGLIIKGSGHVNGKGAIWWNQALHFHKCDNLQLSGFTSQDSPRNHIMIHQCTGVHISSVHLNAPANSPNTDGIDISLSSQIDIHDSSVGTSDDCIAIKGGSSFVNITNVACGPGHGISLGQGEADDRVEQVHVQHCTFTNTQNGARIKTWKGGYGYAKSIFFSQITLVLAQNPIIIDQHYIDTTKSKDSVI
ncbi:hypothetical protein ACFX2F_017317 [Malus domestica]